VVSLSVCVCVLVTFMSPANTAEPIAMPFGGLSRVGPRNHVLDRSADLPSGGAQFLGVVWLAEKHCESLLWCMRCDL